MQAIAHIKSSRLSPNRCPRKDIASGVYVPMDTQATRAVVPALCQILLHYRAALTALLACSASIHVDYLDAGTFSLASKYKQECIPACILDRTSQPAVPQHALHVQAFHSDSPIQSNQLQSNLVMVLAPQVANAGVSLLELEDSLPSIGTTSRLSADRPLHAPQFRQGGFQVRRTSNLISVRCSQERFNPNINSNRRGRTCGDVLFSKIAREDCIPLTAFALQRDGLNFPLDVAVHLNANRPDKLQAQLIADELGSVCESKGEAIKAISPLEPGVASSFEEREVRQVESPQRDLGAIHIKARIERIHLAHCLQPARLVEISDARSIDLPCELAIAERLIVEPSMRFQGNLQFASLIRVGIQPEFIGSAHAEFYHKSVFDT